MKRRLLFLLLPAGAGLVLWAGLAVGPLYVLTLPALILLPLLLGFALQSLALFLSRQRRRWLCFASLLPLLIPVVQAIGEASYQGYFFWQLAVVYWGMAAALYLMGWCAAWALEDGYHV